LVVLSACNTGRDGAESDRGEGFTGLTRSFMYAGADALAVTLWPVESSSAKRLTEEAYRSLAMAEDLESGARALAFARAKRAMLARPHRIVLDPLDSEGGSISTDHPFFWAPFILVGDGQ
ncbi:MAG: CHAT domain-containing protein, partial [Gammaproteobacteria bacterium]|nr:CHAT domain-containing protein [Gammaproteobacteria bacterium]